MTMQIAIRLPDELVEFLDEQVAGGAKSRAAVVAAALRRHERRLRAERDAQIYRDTGGYDDLTGIADLPSPHVD